MTTIDTTSTPETIPAIAKVVLAMFWLIGWLSGGGIFALIFSYILTLLHLMPPNEDFVIGCLWGTGGALSGKFMTKQILTRPMV